MKKYMICILAILLLSGISIPSSAAKKQTTEKVYYVTDADGKVVKPAKNSLVNVAGVTYYVNTKGKAIAGWNIIDGKLYYSSKTGKIKKDVTFEGIKLTKSGAAKKNTASKLKMKTMKVVDFITKKSMSKSQKLRSCFNYIASQGRFRYSPKYPNLSKKG